MLPKDLLKKAQELAKIDITKAIEIYDIDDDINYNYLFKCKTIDTFNEKYIYTLSFENRNKIVNKFNIKRKRYEKKSKEIFKEFVQHLINNFTPNSSLETLNNYKLYNFGRFIIYINEGTEELKYYYFIDLIFQWLTIKKNEKKITSKEKTKYCLKIFKDFFLNNKEDPEISTIFYVLFRIDLVFFDSIIYYEDLLLNAKLMVNQNLCDKIQALKNAKVQIKENIDNIIITDKTILTLKKKIFNLIQMIIIINWVLLMILKLNI